MTVDIAKDAHRLALQALQNTANIHVSLTATRALLPYAMAGVIPGDAELLMVVNALVPDDMEAEAPGFREQVLKLMRDARQFAKAEKARVLTGGGFAGSA